MDRDWWTLGKSYAYFLIFIRDHLDSFVLSIKMSTPLHPPQLNVTMPHSAAWCWVVSQSPNVKHFTGFSVWDKQFSFDILWLAGHLPTCGKNNKAVIDVVNKIFKKYFLWLVWRFILSFLFLFFHLSSVFFQFNNKLGSVAILTGAIFTTLNIIIK